MEKWAKRSGRTPVDPSVQFVDNVTPTSYELNGRIGRTGPPATRGPFFFMYPKKVIGRGMWPPSKFWARHEGVHAFKSIPDSVCLRSHRLCQGVGRTIVGCRFGITDDLSICCRFGFIICAVSGHDFAALILKQAHNRRFDFRPALDFSRPCAIRIDFVSRVSSQK